jgi:hypothetical protein
MIEWIGKDDLKRELQELFEFLRSYILDPIHHIKNPPNLHWQTGIVSIFLINILFGITRAAVSPSVIMAILNFIITPFLAAALMSLVTLFLNYFFRFVLERNIPYRTLFTILLISYIPGSLFFFASVLYPPLFVLGVVVTAALIVVGLVENLKIPKKLVIRLVLCGSLLVLTFWIFQQIYTYRIVNEPKTLDQLENEIDSLGEF